MMKTFALILLIAAPVTAAEPLVRRDLAYAQPQNGRQTLDVYAPSTGRDHPILVWIHGGGWRQGDKSRLQRKPQAFVDQGFVFVSINYRLVPEVTVKEMAGDIAKAIRWVHDHAADFGGSSENVFVAGHSAGAHLAALVCTDERYLQAEGLTLASIKGCMPVDVSVYDIPKRMQDGGDVPPATFTAAFGETEEVYRDLSPVHHVVKGKRIPPFLILHVARRPETRTKSQWFAKELRDAGFTAEVVAAEGKTHGTISSDLGLERDKPTQAVFTFLRNILSQAENARKDE